MKAIGRIGHIRDGVIARYSRANGFKLAICVGFGRDSRPRARLYRATAGVWTTPELVDPARLVPLGKIEIEGPSRQHTVLTRALEGLWTTPELGFGPSHVALLVVGAADPAIRAPTGVTEPERQAMLASYMDLTDDAVRRLRGTCMDGSPLAEACDVFLDHDRESDGTTAMAADLLVEVLNQRAREARQRLEQITDEDLLDLERDPETAPSLRWEAQVALGRGKMRANRSAARRSSARRACLDYWNVSVAEWQAGDKR